jgi:pimeloyl-ACP methyl ester carboxylesterase
VKRRWKILIGILAGLAVLLAVNTFSTNNQTKSAETTIEGGRILKLSGGDIQVYDSQEGSETVSAPTQPIVLLHCYGCSLHWWDKLAPLLEQDHRVIRIDSLGFGGSEKPESGYEIENQAKLVAEALNQLDVQAAMVVGNSMGGGVTASLAEQASQLVDRAVVIDSGPDTQNYGGLPFIARLQYVPVIGQAMWRISPDFLVEKGYEDAFAPGFDVASGFDNPDQVVADFNAMTYTSYNEAHAEYEDFTEAGPLDRRFTQAAVPLMAILGEEDQIVDAEKAAETYSTVPGAQIELIAGAGHSPQIEKPQEVAALLEDFGLSADEYAELVPPVSRSDRPTSPNQQGGQRRKNRPQSGAQPDGGQAERESRQGSDRKKNN